MPYTIVCRAQLTDECFHGQPTARQFDEDLPMTEDGTYREDHLGVESIVCDVCYVSLGAPNNDELDRLIAYVREGRELER